MHISFDQERKKKSFLFLEKEKEIHGKDLLRSILFEFETNKIGKFYVIKWTFIFVN